MFGQTERKPRKNLTKMVGHNSARIHTVRATGDVLSPCIKFVEFCSADVPYLAVAMNNGQFLLAARRAD
jgi:hypothetical protein